MGNTIRWIFFDCIDTLLRFRQDTTRPYWQGMGEVAQQLGLTDCAAAFSQAYDRIRSCALKSVDEAETTLQIRLKDVFAAGSAVNGRVSDTQLFPVIEAFRSGYARCISPEEGVRDMLGAWQGKVKMGVVSNFILEKMPAWLLEKQGLSSYFDFILDSATVGWRKPGPQIYHHAMALAGICAEQADQVVFVGDHPLLDVIVPRRLGMQVVHYARRETAVDDAHSIRHWDEFRPGRLY